MIKIEYCSICGKIIHGIVRNCSHCARPLCKKHSINGLCPDHVHTMTKGQAKSIQRQTQFSIWIILVAGFIGAFSLMFAIFGLLWGDNKTFGYVSLGIFVVVVIIAIILLRISRKKTTETHDAIKQDFSQGRKICPNCFSPVKIEDSQCPSCKFVENPETQKPIAEYTSHPEIDTTLQAIVDANPESKIEVTSFYDEATQSGFHVCKKCNKRFETKIPTKNCPYCLHPIDEYR